jgi:Ankyrin repeats (3 copies)
MGKTKEAIMPRLATAGLCLGLSLLLAAARSTAAADDPGDALRRAASAGDLAKVKELLAAGVDVNAANSYGGTALAFAADKGQTAIVELLLERGANANIEDSFYHATPLAWAVNRGHAEIVRLLLAKGAEGEAQALASAAGQGKTAVVKTILDRGKLGPEALSEALAAASQGQRSERAEVVALLEAVGAKPPAAVVVDPAVLKTYEGTFDGEGFSLKVAMKEGKLTMSVDGGNARTLAPIDPVTFRVEEAPGLKIAFQVEAGKVRGLTFDRGGSTTQLTKKETP